MSYYICIKYIYIRQYHVIVQKLSVILKKMQISQTSPQNIILPVSCSVFIPVPWNLQKSSPQPNLHPKSTPCLFVQSRCFTISNDSSTTWLQISKKKKDSKESGSKKKIRCDAWRTTVNFRWRLSGERPSPFLQSEQCLIAYLQEQVTQPFDNVADIISVYYVPPSLPIPPKALQAIGRRWDYNLSVLSNLQ